MKTLSDEVTQKERGGGTSVKMREAAYRPGLRSFLLSSPRSRSHLRSNAMYSSRSRLLEGSQEPVAPRSPSQFFLYKFDLFIPRNTVTKWLDNEDGPSPWLSPSTVWKDPKARTCMWVHAHTHTHHTHTHTHLMCALSLKPEVGSPGTGVREWLGCRVDGEGKTLVLWRAGSALNQWTNTIALLFYFLVPQNTKKSCCSISTF